MNLEEDLNNENHHLWTDNEVLREKLRIAKEALKFYADEDNYYMRRFYANTNVRNDGGKIAKEALDVL